MSDKTESLSPKQAAILPLLTAALSAAAMRWRALHEQWIRISCKVGGMLPNSLLMHSVQEIGRLDMILRTIEDEWTPNDPANFPWGDTVRHMLSNLWVGSTYEIFRLLVDNTRKLITDPSDEFESISRDLKLLRIPIEKHEIADDRRLRTPLEMQRATHDGGAPDIYSYKKDDPGRAHIMPMRISARGSAMWQVVDVKQGNSYWIERRALSERIVALWGPPAPDTLEVAEERK